MDSKKREGLFLEMALRAGGATAQEVFDTAGERGSTVTVEAFHNLGRRLVSRGMLSASRDPDGRTRYAAPVNGAERWLDEDEIQLMVDREDPLVSLAVLQETTRQMNDLPEEIWQELRLRLQSADARTVFRDAIKDYCDCLYDEVEHLQILRQDHAKEQDIATQDKKVGDLLQLLRQLARFGLGLSREAVLVPPSVKIAEQHVKLGALVREPFYDLATLEHELASRVEPGMFLKPAEAIVHDEMIIAAVDSSMRGGLLAREGEQADFSVGAFPQVAVTTAVAETNIRVKENGRSTPVFCRLPERPEDVQREGNKYTVSAKIFYPDITDAEYVHLTWNAMDLLEGRMCLKVLKPWEDPNAGFEVPAADVVMKDGAVAPQDRDFSHYRQRDSYGDVVRGLIRVNWDLVHHLRAGGQTLAGVVKNANLRVLAPVLNWYAFDLAQRGGSQITSWSKQRLNLISDQVLMTRLLTAGRGKAEPWVRSALIVRPFHATTNFAHSYSRTRTPKQEILEAAGRHQAEEYPERLSPEEAWMAGPLFKREGDPYVQLLENCWYAGFFLAPVPRLDTANNLPRFEFVIPHPTAPEAVFDWAGADTHCNRLLSALKGDGFTVAGEQSVFGSRFKIDILPAMIARVHDRVRMWSRVFGERMNEVVGYYLRRMTGNAMQRGITCRPWSRDEFEAFKQQMARERTLQEPGPTAVQEPE